VVGLRRQRHDDALAFERRAVLGKIIADQRQLAAHARNRPDAGPGAAGQDFAAGEDQTGIAAEGLAQSGDRQAEAGRAGVAIAEAAKLQIGDAQAPRGKPRVARAEPEPAPARLKEAGDRFARALPDAVEAEVEQFGNLRHEMGGVLFRGAVAGDGLEQMRRLAAGIDERHEYARRHGSNSSTSKPASSASSTSCAESVSRSAPKRSNMPSATKVSPALTRAWRPA